MNRILTPLFVCLTLFSFAQSEHLQCGTDEMHQQLFQQHPEYNAGIIRANEHLQQFTQEWINSPHEKDGDPYIIPVVFHIIHNYGPENISNTQVLDAVNQLNIQFRKLNPDTTDIVNAFKPLAADARIEFRLAQLDPDGNCTSGITRTVSSLTYAGDHQVKGLIHWPSNKYLNVYICKAAAGLAGHALLPGAADTIPQWDGIVLQDSYLGTIGTSEHFRRTVLSHEVGHYLNLQHIWGGNNVPDYDYLPVGQSSNCGVGDEVDDTPLTIGWSTCNTNAFSCGELENVQNYMDYAYCALMFTQGQVDRMHACLNSPVAGRNNLWQQANLEATGTDDLTFYLCTAQMESDKQIVCAGDSVQFVDVSSHGVSSRAWSFEGGTTASLTSASTYVTYNTPGRYDASLKVSNGIDTVELLLEDYITVLSSTGLIEAVAEGFQDIPSLGDRWIVANEGIVPNWEFAAAGFESDQSFYVNNFDNEEGRNYEFHSYTMDVSDYSSLAVSYDFAYAQRAEGNTDVFRIYTSTDCAETWQLRKSYNGLNSLKSVEEPVTTSFTPANESEWKSDTLILTSSSVFTENLMIRFRFEGRGGNNFYLDNIRIARPEALGIDETAAQVSVYPNPASDQLFIRSNGKSGLPATVEMLELSGKLVSTWHFAEGIMEGAIDTRNLKQGYYLLKLTDEQGETVRPVVIGH